MSNKSLGTKAKQSLDTAKEYLKDNVVKIVLIILGCVYGSGLCALGIEAFKVGPQVIAGEMESPFTFNPFKVFVAAFTHISGYVILAILAILFAFVYTYHIKTRRKEVTGEKDEQREITYADNDAYGSSRLENVENLQDIIDIKPLKDTCGMILGKPLSSDTSDITLHTDIKKKEQTEVIALPADFEYDAKNKDNKWSIDEFINNKTNYHTAVLGASGTMKSRALAFNMIMQAPRRGESIIVTDPKGELYEKSYQYLVEEGYDVKMFNLVNQQHSDSWNCLMELLDKDGNVDSTNAKIFADTIVINAKPDGKGDSYWNDNAANLLKAVCLLVAEDDRFPQNIGTVYDLIANKTLQEIDVLFRELPETSVARRAYNIFYSCSEQVKGQIINGLGIMLGVFQDQAIRNITTEMEIDLTKPATEKCAYFIITSDQHKIFDFLAVLFYSMLFIKLVERVDSLRSTPEEKNLRHIHLVLDEFPNIGSIPDFCKKISTVRSRNIDITVIFQNIVQLQNRYPYGQWEEILGNCDVTVFLGCTDQTTAEYISNRTGIASIEVETQNTEYDRSIAVFNQATTYHEVRSTGQRKVLNPDEVLRFKNTEELILIRGQKPFKAKKFDYTLHTDAERLVPTPISSHIPAWRQKQLDEEAEMKRLRAEREAERERRHQEELQRIQDEAKNSKEDLENGFSNMFAQTTKHTASKGQANSPIKDFSAKDDDSDNSNSISSGFSFPFNIEKAS